jgi:hypothetical protein
MNLKRFIACLMIVFVFPYAIVKVIPENIREARLIENAPYYTVTVTSKWTQFINPRTNGYWIAFSEKVANTHHVQITSEEWNAVSAGGQITIAVLPDGRPHTLNSGANVAFEQLMFGVAMILWVAATMYVINVIRGWLRSASRVEEALE